MKKEQPIVSIFLPYYNDKKYIKDTINSVLEQTYQNWELFLFNHASTDGSDEIAKSFNDIRIKQVESKENLGAGSGYNLKTTLPLMDKNSKYLKLMCADDKLKPEFLEKMVQHLELNPDVDVAFCDMEYESEDNTKLQTSWLSEHPDTLKSYDNSFLLRQIIMRASPLPFPANFIRKKVLDDVSLDYTSIMLFDISLWGQLLVQNKKINFIQEQLVVYKINDAQVSSIKNFKKSLQQSYFESSYVYDIFYKISDVKLIRKVIKNIDYVDDLNDDDSEFIPFIVAYYYLASIKDATLFYSCHPSIQINGYRKLCELLSDEVYAKKLKDKFGFGIKEFRALYSYMPTLRENHVSLKQRILNKPARNLSLLQLSFVVGRKLVHCVSPFHHIKKIKKKFSKNKQYTI